MFSSDTSIANVNTPVPGLIVICGPTASGKSGLAIAIAHRLNSVILSADSRQVYRNFNIGTAKPTEFEQQQVPHYLIDICDPTETLTVADYQQQAQQLIEKLHRQNHDQGRQDAALNCWRSSMPYPLLVGGTGLYIKSVTRGLQIPRVPPQEALRSQLLGLGQVHCYALLQQVDPIAAAKIHANDAVRTVRSLEVFYVTGQPMSAQQGEYPPTYPILQIGLDCTDPDGLRRRIEKRTGQMVDMGLTAEVELLCHTYSPELPLLNTLGYAEFKRYLVGEISQTEAQNLTVLHTRQFAKRQRTWFRAYPEIEWFDADALDLVDHVWQRIQEFLSR